MRKMRDQPKRNRCEWEHLVRKNLVHPDAIKCILVDSVLDAWWQCGFPARRIAIELNKRYSSGYLERKQPADM
jgi:hypothetical protein